EKRVLTGSEDGTARLWSRETGDLVGEPMNHDGVVQAVAFGPDGKSLATAAAQNDRVVVTTWDSGTSRRLFEHALRHDCYVGAVTFSPDGSLLLTGSDDWKARVWDVKTGKLLGTVEHSGPVTAVAFSPDGKTVLTGSWDRRARLCALSDILR